MMCPVPIAARVGCAANKGILFAGGSFPGTAKATTNFVDDKVITGHCVASHRLCVEAAHLTGGTRHFSFAAAPILGQCWPRERWRVRSSPAAHEFSGTGVNHDGGSVQKESKKQKIHRELRRYKRR